MKGIARLGLALLALPAAGGALAQPSTAAEPARVRLGVIAFRGSERARLSWQPTADYLAAEIPGHVFEVVPLKLPEIQPRVARGELEFLVTNPANYVEMESRHGATRILTLKRLHREVACKVFAGVIFTRAEREEIQGLADLKGRSFMAYDPQSFGGWWMAWRELKVRGIDPHRDFTSLRFARTDQDAVVFAVRDGEVDAGTVRTGELEELAAEGKIDLAALRILNPRPPTRDFPFLASTRLYPEWPLAVMKHTPEELASDVASALLKLPPASPAARAAGCAGWTIPQYYTEVHDCLRELSLPPYDAPARVPFSQVASEYRWPIAGTAVGVILLLAAVVYVSRLNRDLDRLRVSLEEELAVRRRTEEALRTSENRTRQIVESAYEAFVAINEAGAITDWNGQAEAIFGWRREEALGRLLVETIVPPQHREAHRRGLQRFLATGEGPVLRTRIELTALHRDGREFPIELSIFPLRQDGAWTFHSFLHDITDRKDAERLLQSQNRLLEESARSEREAHQALRKAQSRLLQAEKLASLGQLVAGVAHEINNPLAFVSNNLAVLRRDVAGVCQLLGLYRKAEDLIEKDRPQDLERIRAFAGSIDLDYVMENLHQLFERSDDGLKRIIQIVRDLRNFARLDESDLHEVDLNAGIESTINIVKGRAAKKAIAIEVDLAPLPPVCCYPAKINQVVMNLVSNAIDACGEGGRIGVSTRAVGEEVLIEVADNGTGIDPAIVDRIFDPFFTTKPPGAGTGLGLSISYGIVQDHRGAIEVDSQPGRGSRFTVRLPLQAISQKS